MVSYIKLLIFQLLILKASCIEEVLIDKVCTSDIDCQPPYLVCKNQKCQRKNLFPMELSEFFGFILIVLIASLAAAAGIGGGVIIVPVSLLFFNLSSKQAAALSNLLILVNAFFKYVFGMKRTDPLKKEKTLIDYSLVLLFNPILLFANVIGNIINKMLPDGVILSLLAGLLIVTIIINLKNGIKLWKKEKNPKIESENLENRSQPQQDNNHNLSKVYDDKNENMPPDFETMHITESMQNPIQNNVDQNKTDQKITLKEQKFFDFIKKYEGSNWNPVKISILISTILIITLFTFLRGSSKFKSIVGSEKCSVLDWILLLILLLLIVVIYVLSILYVKKEIAVKKKFGYLMKHEMNYTLTQIAILSLVIFIVGIISIIVGLGGGIILFPMFVYLGVQPIVVSFSILFMVFLSKITTVILNSLEGLLIPDLSIFMVFWMSVLVIISLTFFSKLLKKSGRQSLIVFLMAFVLICSLIVIPIYAFKEGVVWKFKSYCS